MQDLSFLKFQDPDVITRYIGIGVQAGLGIKYSIYGRPLYCRIVGLATFVDFITYRGIVPLHTHLYIKCRRGF